MPTKPKRTCARFSELLSLWRTTPLIGRPCDEVRVGYRRHAAGSHTLYYRVAASGVLIDVVRILHRHTDVERHLD
ncbi:putative plasmid stabilization protein ParE [Mycobacterium sp. H4Y]|nr:putative plasmid stabilization protein ParE [Mycobacterium sp. H4Y]